MERRDKANAGSKKAPSVSICLEIGWGRAGDPFSEEWTAERARKETRKVQAASTTSFPPSNSSGGRGRSEATLLEKVSGVV